MKDRRSIYDAELFRHVRGSSGHNTYAGANGLVVSELLGLLRRTTQVPWTAPYFRRSLFNAENIFRLQPYIYIRLSSWSDRFEAIRAFFPDIHSRNHARYKKTTCRTYCCSSAADTYIRTLRTTIMIIVVLSCLLYTTRIL